MHFSWFPVTTFLIKISIGRDDTFIVIGTYSVVLGVKLWNKNGRRVSRGHMGVKGAPSGGIELVLSEFLFR
jgi:hypothetical protein